MKKIILILVAIILSSSFAYSQCNTKPTINSFAPNTGFIGSTVTIFGANFDANTISNNKVFFGATQATVQSANFGQLVVTVPVGASTARISVTNQCKLTAYSKAPFNGIFCPTPLDNSTYQNSAQNLSITYGAYNMIAVDLDLDGKPEVLSGGQGGGVSVAKNNSTPGNISFQALNFSQFGASSIYTADFDGDGLQDIVSRNIALLNTSTGPGNINFGPAISTNSVSSYQVAAGDFNNDGKIDIVGEDGSVIYIAKNNSTGPGNLSFSARQSIENVGTRCTGIMVADVDGDGKQDILATQGNLDRAVTLRNTTPDGSSTFTFEPFEAWPTNGDYPYRCQIADFNKDGKMDLTTCNFSSTANTAIFINTSTPGDISFATTINLPAPNSNYRIQVGDVDGDGYPDIVTKSTAQNVFSVYKNTTTNVNNTSFAARIDYSSSAAAEVSGIVVGDLDGDFVPDIATSGTSSRQIRIHRNTSSQQDNTPPTAICKNINVGLNPSGSVTITPSQVDNGSSDACGIDNISLSQTTFTCADIGNNVVTLIVTDLAGNTDTCSAIVNVQPAAIIVAGQTTVCAGQTISISANPGDSYQWKVDGVAIAGATSQTFTASQSGSYTVVVTNAGGCSGESVPTTLTISTGSNVSVTPTNATITCGSPTTLTAGNAATYQWKFNGTNIAGATISTYAATQAGQYSVDVIDIFGCPGTSNTVNLVVGTQVVTAKDATVYLDINGNLNLDPSIIDDGSSQNCPAGNLSVNPSSFTCSDIGSHAVILTLTYNGLSVSDTAIVTVLDTIAPTTSLSQGTIYLDSNGQATVSASDVNNGTSDACGIATLAVSPTTFDCTNIGQGSSSSEVPLNYIGSRVINHQSYGGGFNPNTNEFWFPQWSGSNVYKYDAITGAYNGIINLATQPNMQLWMEQGSSDIYTANWGSNSVSRYNGNTQVWTYNIGSIGANITTDANYVYTVPYNTNKITVLNKSNGTLVNNFILPGNLLMYGGLVHSNGKLYAFGIAYFGNVQGTWNAVHIFDAANGTHLSSQSLPTPTYFGVSFDGEVAWVGNGNQIEGYQIASGSSYGAGSGAKNVVAFSATDVNGNISYDTTSVTVLDTLAPVVQTNNVTVYLDASGNATVTLNDIDNGITDNCAIDSISLSGNTSYDCSHIGGNTVSITATDSSANSTSVNATVTVIDSTKPTILVNNITVTLDANLQATISINDIDAGSSDNCTLNNLALGQTTFDCNDKGQTIAVTLTGTDQSGNTASAVAQVTVTDPSSHCNQPPTAVCQNITIYTGSTCDASITANNVDGGSTDPDGDALTYSLNQSGPFGVGTYTVTLTVDDGEYTDACTAVVTVVDSTSPAALCQDVTVTLDANGQGTILGQPTTNTVFNEQFQADANAGNSATLTNWNVLAGNVDVNDFTTGVGREIDMGGNTNATIETKSTINLQPGTYEFSFHHLTNSNPNPNNSLNIQIGSLLNETFPAPSSVQQVTRTITVTSPISVSIRMQEVGTNDNSGTFIGNITLTEIVPGALAINNGSSDNCGVASITASQTTFDCTNVGTNAVTLTVTDINGNVSSCTATVTVLDLTAPTAVCQNINVILDNDGNASITAADIDNGSSDVCGSVSLNASQTLFDCSHTGANSVVLTVTDQSGNSSTCTSTVTVIDNEDPIIVGNNNNLNMDFNGGSGAPVSYTEDGITFLSLYGSSSHVHLGDNDGDGSGDILNHANCCSTPYRLTVGAGTEFTLISMNVKRVSGNPTFSVHPSGPSVTITSTGIFTFPASFADATEIRWNQNVGTMVIDDVVVSTKTTGSCPADIVVNTDAGSCGAIVNYASNVLDNCSASIAFSPASGSFFNLGTTTVTTTATDASGNTSSCTFDVTVNDNEAPVTLTQDITVQLDASGNASIGTGDIDNGSNDACGIASLALDNTSFTCADVGANTVTLTSTDVNGNSSSATATVTVEDNVNPVTLTQDITVQLDASGNASIGTGDIDNGSNDACGIASLALDNTSFTCADVGANTVTLTSTDVNGNSSSATATVTVEDNVNPVTLTQDITVQLDASGNASIGTGDIDNGSNDACGIASLALDNTSFTCADVGANTVTLTSTDVNGNSSSATATVTVEDNVNPVTLTQDITVQLDASGNASIGTGDIDNGSNDACGIASLALDNTSFTCADVGANTVTLTSTDVNGNSSSATATVTVEDNVNPVTLTQDITVQLDASGNASIGTGDIDNGSNDACGIASLALDITSFTCADVGANTVTLTSTDVNGNSSSATATVTVEDNVDPIALCQNVTVTLNNGMASITPQMVDNGSNDACGIESLSVDFDSWDCNDIGNHPVVLTVTDNNGNVSSCNATVTVVGEIPTCSITSNPTSNTYTGGDDNVLYLGYGAQSTVLNVSPSGGSSFTYSWTGQDLSSTTSQNPTFTPTQEGTYVFDVLVTNNFGCQTTCSITICVKDIRVRKNNGSIQPGKVYICHVPPGKPNKTLTLSVSVNAVPSHLGNHAGDALGECGQICNSNAQVRMKTPIEAIEDNHSHGNDVKLYPNPSNGTFNLEFEGEFEEMISIEIRTLSGQLVKTEQLNGALIQNRVQLDINDQAKGVYFITIRQKDYVKVIKFSKM